MLGHGAADDPNDRSGAGLPLSRNDRTATPNARFTFTSTSGARHQPRWPVDNSRPMPRAAKASAEPKTTSRRRATMTVEHKAALAAGRDEGRTVRRYSEAPE